MEEAGRKQAEETLARKKEQERIAHEQWMKEMRNDAALWLSVLKVKLDTLIEEAKDSLRPYVLRSISDPSVEQRMVKLFRSAGCEVKGLKDIETFTIEFWRDWVRELVKRKLKDNPYQWWYHYL